MVCPAIVEKHTVIFIVPRLSGSSGHTRIPRALSEKFHVTYCEASRKCVPWRSRSVYKSDERVCAVEQLGDRSCNPHDSVTTLCLTMTMF